jgi:hypothetical protein
MPVSAVSPPDAGLRQFQWSPSSELGGPPTTHIERGIRAFRDAVEQFTRSADGRAFGRLNRHPDYSLRYERGYALGRSDGFWLAAGQWYDEYTDMLQLMVDAMVTLLKSTRLLNMLLASAVDELLVRPFDTSRPPVFQSPRYRELREALQAGRPLKPSEINPAATGDVDPEVAEMMEVAAHADAMRRVPERLWDSRVMERIDVQVADWIDEFRAATSSMLPEVLALNCKPFEQGYYVGSWTSQAIVKTIRRAVEATLHRIGTDPLILDPMTMTEKVLDLLIQNVAIELLDED